jgi:hypothetical protein
MQRRAPREGETTHSNVSDIKVYSWNKHCRDLYELPVVA